MLSELKMIGFFACRAARRAGVPAFVLGAVFTGAALAVLSGRTVFDAMSAEASGEERAAARF
jgi:hypothetical protein